MYSLKYAVVNLLETIFRLAPVPYKTGLIKIGNPNENSPVFLTCNYHLTVERVKRALRGMDCYLLIANSRGINVWCAATGGHFTNHDVISALKTSGVERLVDHREVILPQLAAAGIESKVIKKKTSWKVSWGPVYAKDISAYLNNNFEKTPAMREVEFPAGERMEMAAMWAFPFSLVSSAVALPFWSEIVLPLNLLIWGLSISVFLSFPLYSGWLNPKRKGNRFSKYTVVFDLGRIPLFLWTIFLSFLVVGTLSTDTFTWEMILRWGFVSLVLLLLIGTDLTGSTPVYKSGLHEDRFLEVILDGDKCKGAGDCERVCPRNCFEVDRDRHIATQPGADRCVQCGACIVQCPFDALYFKSPGGDIATPGTIRKFKLNLTGKRLKKTAL